MSRTTIGTAHTIELGHLYSTLQGRDQFTRDFVELLLDCDAQAHRRDRHDLLALTTQAFDAWFAICRANLGRRDTSVLVAVLAQQMQLALRGPAATGDFPAWLVATDASATWWLEQVECSFRRACHGPALDEATFDFGWIHLAGELEPGQRHVGYALAAARQVLATWPQSAGWIDSIDRERLHGCLDHADLCLSQTGATPANAVSDLVTDLLSDEWGTPADAARVPYPDATPCEAILSALMEAINRMTPFSGVLEPGSRVVVRPPADAPDSAPRGRAILRHGAKTQHGMAEVAVQGKGHDMPECWLTPLVPIGFVPTKTRSDFASAA